MAPKGDHKKPELLLPTPGEDEQRLKDGEKSWRTFWQSLSTKRRRRKHARDA